MFRLYGLTIDDADAATFALFAAVASIVSLHVSPGTNVVGQVAVMVFPGSIGPLNVG